MKKLLLMAVVVLTSLTASAQAGTVSAGLNVNYGISDGYKALGFGAKAQYEFIDRVRGEFSANYFLPKDDAYVWDCNLNFHYLVPLGGLSIYPLAGVTLMTSAVKGDTKELLEKIGADTSDSRVGFNVGAGLEFPVAPTIKLNLEGKYQYAKDSDWPVFSIGVAYTL